MRGQPFDWNIVYEGRGTGRSTRQLESLREGDVFVSTMDRGYVRRLIQSLDRDPTRYLIVRWDDGSVYKMYGLLHDRWIEVDHACPVADWQYQRIREFVQMHNSHHGVRTFA